MISVLCTALLFSKQSSGACCLSPEKWNSKARAGFALYNLILYHNNALMQDWKYFRREWMLIIYPLNGTCSQAEGLWGSGGWFSPTCTVDEQAACTKCRLTPRRQVSHSRMQTSIWKAVSAGFPHRCNNDCSGNIILPCAKAFFNLCFQMGLSCCHMSST